MIVSSTKMQNNFGNYLKLCKYEEIIVSRNNKNIAKLVKYDDECKNISNLEEVVREKSLEYHTENEKMSYEDFIELSEASENRYEFIDGQLYMMASPGVTHQKVQANMFLIFGNWFKGKKCTSFVSPFDITLVKLESGKNVVQPDIMVICDLEEMTDEKDRYMGTPALVVEILSKTTRNRDMLLKMDLYMNSGVKEYWIVNPFNKKIHLYLFENYELSETYTRKGNETAESFMFEGLKVNLAEIF